MKLNARLFPLAEAATELLRQRLPPAALVAESARYPVDVEDPVLEQILAEGDRAGGFWVAGETVFSPTERATSTHFELVCRSIARESAADFTANDAVRARTPKVDAGGSARIRLMSGLFLSRIALQPHMVGAIGDWTGEFVLGSGVVKAFADAGLTGYSLVPIAHPKSGTAHEGCAQLFSDAVLGPATIDHSVERVRSAAASEHGQLRHLGCLSYPPDALASRPDFNRTAEPWAGWHGWPSWVVSRRVEETFRQSKLRGWHFRPVIETGTDLYERYDELWRRLRELVASTTRSAMDGGRW